MMAIERRLNLDSPQKQYFAGCRVRHFATHSTLEGKHAQMLRSCQLKARDSRTLASLQLFELRDRRTVIQTTLTLHQGNYFPDGCVEHRKQQGAEVVLRSGAL